MIAGIQCYLVSIEVHYFMLSACALGMGDIDNYVYDYCKVKISQLLCLLET